MAIEARRQNGRRVEDALSLGPHLPGLADRGRADTHLPDRPA